MTPKELERALIGRVHPNDCERLVGLAEKSDGRAGFIIRAGRRLPKYEGDQILEEAADALFPDEKIAKPAQLTEKGD